MSDPLSARILAELGARYARRYHCPNSWRRAGEPECTPWFTFRWLTRLGEPGRIRVWFSCASAELDEEFDLAVGPHGDLSELDESAGACVTALPGARAHAPPA